MSPDDVTAYRVSASLAYVIDSDVMEVWSHVFVSFLDLVRLSDLGPIEVDLDHCLIQRVDVVDQIIPQQKGWNATNLQEKC